jgi:hypothetical protein
MYPLRSAPHKEIWRDEVVMELLTTQNHSVINSLTKILSTPFVKDIFINFTQTIYNITKFTFRPFAI